MSSLATSFNAVLLCRFTASAYVLCLLSATRSARTRPIWQSRENSKYRKAPNDNSIEETWKVEN